MMNWCVLVIFAFFKFGVCSSPIFSCTDKNISLYGVGDILARSLMGNLGPSYSAFRAKFNINVTVATFTQTVYGVNYILDGMTGPAVFTGQIPIMFAMSPYETPRHKNDIEFPLAAQAIAIIYNLPNISTLNISTSNLVQMYDGRIQYWNDPLIAVYNPNIKLPAAKILPIARADGDATTVFFTTILSSTSEKWNKTYGSFGSPGFVNGVCCNSTVWPPTIFMFGNYMVGMVGLVASVTYSVGYATLDAVRDYSFIGKAGLIVAGQDTKTSILPTIENVQNRMFSFINRTTVDKVFIDVNANDSLSAYPLTIFPYVVTNITYDKSVDCCFVQELAGLLDWLNSPEADNLVLRYGYIPTVSELSNRIFRNVITVLSCSSGTVYESYLASMDPSTPMPTWLIAVITAIVIIVLVVVAIGLYFVYNKYYFVDEGRWFIDISRIKVAKDSIGGKHTQSSDRKSDSKNSSVSLHRTSTSQNTTSQQEALKFFKEFMVKGEIEENKVHLDALACRIPQQWSNFTKRKIIQWKTLLNKNVTTIFGITTIGPQPHGVFEYCQKGTLHYVLLSSRYNLTTEIKYQFALDVAAGMKYLHYHGIVHGYLNSLTCYMDTSWTVKVAHWEKLSIYQTENPHQNNAFATYKDNLVTDDVRLIEFLYVDPKLLERVQPSVDVFSFGVLMVEIFTRKLPYADTIEDGTESYSEILAKKFMRYYMVPPKLKNSLKDVTHLCTKCWSIEESRPTMSQMYNALRSLAKNSNGIVDIIMDVLEKHAEALEEKVEERTAELKQVTERMRHLLHEVLPSQIAQNLLSGQPVLPEQFECITVYFSDIVGFTTLSAISSPMEVMTLLNDLWLAFDNVIEKFDVYKVDTIGDAYMVCSGLPARNGMEHCRQIALLALALLEKCNRFKITHLPKEQLKIRIGINSGPAIAGVVGSKMPQYCVFGDTVNTAARMESTSMPQKIQMSDTTNRFLESSYPNQFEIAYRGEVDVKVIKL